MEFHIQMRKTALYLMILLSIKIWHVYAWKKNLASIADASLWTNTNQAAFIQLNLQVLYRLFKYAFCVSKRVYGIVLEPLLGIVSFLSHSRSLPYLHQVCVVLSVGEATWEKKYVGTLHSLSSDRVLSE